MSQALRLERRLPCGGVYDPGLVRTSPARLRSESAIEADAEVGIRLLRVIRILLPRIPGAKRQRGLGSHEGSLQHTPNLPGLHVLVSLAREFRAHVPRDRVGVRTA